MTIKRIYIRGNVGDPNTLTIFDADTDKLLHVASMSMDLNPKKATASITLLHSSSFRVKVVPGPLCPQAGKVLKEIELEQYRNYAMTVHRATATDWTVQPDGTVEPNRAGAFSQQHSVDDVTLAAYPGNPSDILKDSARQALTGVMYHMISPQLAAAVATKPIATGGSVAKAPVPWTPGYIPGAANPNVAQPPAKIKHAFDPPVTQNPNHSGKSNSNSKAPCEECGGSGEYISQITHKKSDCSQGCKRLGK